MVIHHFNRIIKNKWIWGVFAVAISAFFAFDFLFTGDNRSANAGTAGKMDGKDVALDYFNVLREDVRSLDQGRDKSLPYEEVNKRAWIAAAGLAVADELGIAASDDDVRQVVRRQFSDDKGEFDYARYLYILKANLGMTGIQYEAALRRRLTLEKVRSVLAGAATWVSPMELDRALDDVTDAFTVRIATFVDKDAAKVDLNDKIVVDYYNEHTNSYALPDLMTIRYVKFQADAPARLAQFKISDAELQDHYSATSDRFETKGTNGVTVTKSLDEVKPQLVKELQLIASLEAYRTNLPFRVYVDPEAAAAARKTSKLDEIAKAEKLTVQTSRPFSPEGDKFVRGLMVRPSEIVPGRSDLAEVASRLDPEADDLRYGVVMATNAVYLIERASFITNHVASLEDVRKHTSIKADALVDARAKAFKAAVEKKRALAAAALAKGTPFDKIKLEGANVSTSITYSVTSIRRSSFPDSSLIARPVMKLAKGQLSDFIPTMNNNRGLLVYVENRVPGGAADAEMFRTQLREELGNAATGELFDQWSDNLLVDMDVQPSDSTSMEKPDDDGTVQ